jgi:hypothetical protein
MIAAACACPDFILEAQGWNPTMGVELKRRFGDDIWIRWVRKACNVLRPGSDENATNVGRNKK